MFRKIKVNSISTKLMLVGIIVALVSTIPIGVASFFYAKEGMTGLSRIQLSILAETEAGDVEEYILGIIEDIKHLSHEQTLYDPSISRENKLRELKDFMEETGRYEDISFADSKGIMVADTLSAAGSVRDRTWYSNALAKDLHAELRPSVNLGGRWVLAVSKAVRDQSGNFQGVVVIRKDMEKFFSSYIQETQKSYQERGFIGYPWFVDGTGLLIGHVKTEKAFNENLSETGTADLKEIVGRMLEQKSGSGHYNYEGVTKSVGYAPIQVESLGIKWAVGITLDDDALYVYINKIRNSAVIFGSILILIVCGVSVMVSRWISGSIIKLKETMGRAADGDLTVKARIMTNDEIGDITKAFNELLETQKTMINSIKSSTDTVAASSQQMSAISEEIASSSQNQSAATEQTLSSMEELDASIQNISRNVQEVVTNISGVARLVEDMDKAIENISASMNHVNSEALNTISATEFGADAVEKSREGMERINQSVGNLVAVVKGLGKSAVDIGEIVEVIDDIAEQTNLLALNAAIEAARAGEHGKGFAVVASAIRNLAEKSGEATKEISKLIRGIQEEVGRAVETAKEGAEEVDKGVQLAGETGKALAVIKEAVDNTAREVEKVSALTQEQEKSIKEVVGASENINDLAQTMAATVQEQTAASSEVVRAVENVSQSANQIATGTGEIAASTEGLAKEAQKLSEFAARFRT